MSTFVENTWFKVLTCGACNMQFAMTQHLYEKRLADRKSFFCPAGHERYFAGESEAQKLKRELERKQQMLDAAQSRAATAEQERKRISKAHKTMRMRVMNGVCPCCNRTFENLMRHMKSEHPEFEQPQTLKAIRLAFGMTQAAVANEAGLDSTQVSMYERNQHVAPYVKERLDNWLENHAAKEPS